MARSTRRMRRSDLHVVGREPLESDTPSMCGGGEALAEQEQPKYDGPERRRGDSEIVEHVKAADTAVEMIRRWGTIIAIVIGFGWTLRSYDSGIQQIKIGQAAQEKALDDFKVEVRGRFDQIGSIASKASTAAHHLQLRYEQLAKLLDEE